MRKDTHVKAPSVRPYWTQGIPLYRTVCEKMAPPSRLVNFPKDTEEEATCKECGEGDVDAT